MYAVQIAVAQCVGMSEVAMASRRKQKKYPQ